MNFDDKFRDEREYLYRQANYFFDLVDLYSEIFKEDRSEECGVAPAFWGLVIDSLYYSMILWGCKLLDDREQRCFRSFLRLVRNNLGEFSKDKLGGRLGSNDKESLFFKSKNVLTAERVASLKGELDSLGVIRDNLKEQRDKFIAHFDREVRDFKSYAEKYPIKWDDLGRMKSVFDKIFDEVSASFDGRSYRIESVNNKDVTAIFNILQRHRMSRRNSEAGRHFERSGAE